MKFFIGSSGSEYQDTKSQPDQTDGYMDMKPGSVSSSQGNDSGYMDMMMGVNKSKFTHPVTRKPDFGFPTRSNINQAVQAQRMVRGLKFWISVEEGLQYSENKGADQLCVYRTADLRLHFHIFKKQVFKT